MWRQAVLSQVDAKAQFHEFHYPHEDDETGRDKQTSKKPFLFKFLFHDGIAFCNNHAFANIGNYGRPAHISIKKKARLQAVRPKTKNYEKNYYYYAKNGILTTIALRSLLRTLMKISVSFLLKALQTNAVPMFLPVEGEGLPERTIPMTLPSASQTS